MNIEEIRNIALAQKGTIEDIKWENHLCFNVGSKMYLVTCPDTFPITASFKASDENFEKLSTREGIIPAPYMARHKWLHVDNIERLSLSEWEVLIQESYDLVFSKLTGKVKKEILG